MKVIFLAVYKTFNAYEKKIRLELHQYFINRK